MSDSPFTREEFLLLVSMCAHIRIPHQEADLLRSFLAARLLGRHPALAMKVIGLGAAAGDVLAMRLYSLGGRPEATSRAWRVSQVERELTAQAEPRPDEALARP